MSVTCTIEYLQIPVNSSYNKTYYSDHLSCYSVQTYSVLQKLGSSQHYSFLVFYLYGPLGLVHSPSSYPYSIVPFFCKLFPQKFGGPRGPVANLLVIISLVGQSMSYLCIILYLVDSSFVLSTHSTSNTKKLIFGFENIC